MGSKEIILKMLKESVGEIVSADYISKQVKAREWPRQLRMLRQEGYEIVWKAKEKGYILASLDKKRGIKRNPINAKQRYRILQRDNYRCTGCGRGPDDNVKLQIDHKIPVDLMEIKDYKDEDLQTLCEECNLGKKHFYSDFDKEELSKIRDLKSGMQRIEAIFTYRKNMPVSVSTLEAISGIRDWERTLRYLRKNKKMAIFYDRINKTYTYHEE